MYNSQLAKRREAQGQQQEQQTRQEAEERERTERENQGFLLRSVSTLGDIVGNVLTGAAKGLEGVVDMGIGLAGALGGIFSENFRNSVKDVVEHDAAGEWFGKPLQELTKYSYTNDGKVGEIIEDVAESVGQMLPAVAVSAATAGLGAAPAAAQMASLGTLGVSAAGTGTESAFQDGADYYAGLGYGAASGAVEMATEKLFGGTKATKALFGKGVADKVGRQIADTGIKRVVKGAAEEGLEEVASELVNPALKGIYKGGEAFEEYTQGDYWGGVLKAGTVGALTSLAYSGTVGYGMAKHGKGYTGRAADINESLEKIEAQKQTAERLFADSKLSEANQAAISANLKGNYDNIQKALIKSKPDKRAEMIKEFSLDAAFDSDGFIRPEFAGNLGFDGNNAGADARYYSPSLRGREESINALLAEAGTRIYSGELTPQEQENYDKIKKVQNALSQKGVMRSKLVLSESSEAFDSLLGGDVIVMGKDALESDVWQKKIMHEAVHFAEQTKEWEDFASFVLTETDAEGAIQAVMERDYGIAQEDAEAVRAAIARGNFDMEQFSDEQKLLISEAVAVQSEALVENEKMLEKLAGRKPNLVQRILERIKSFIQVLRAKTPEEKQLIRNLDNARSLLEKALEKGGSFYAYRVSAAMQSGVEDSGDLQYNDGTEESQLSRKKASYISYDKIGAENVSYVREKLNSLYSEIDNAVADGIAIEKGTTVYIVDSGKDNGEISFGFRKKITISDDVERKEYIRRINNEAIERAFLSDGLSRRLGAELVKHRGRDMRRESREESSADNRESQHNQSGISRTNGDRGRRVDSENGSAGEQDEIKFSRKEKQQLSPGQLKRVIANNTRRRVYSKTDAETVVNNILNNYMDFGNKIGDISGKTKAEAVNMLWESYNSLDEGRRARFALDAADYIIYQTTLEDLWQDEKLNEHARITEALKPYLHTLDLSSLGEEIKGRYDGDNSIYLRWAKPKGQRGVPVDIAAMELAGSGISTDSYNPADILFALDDMYRESRQALSANVKQYLADSLDEKTRERLRQDIAKEILRGFDYTGKASKLDGIISKYEQEIRRWKEKYYEEKEWNNAVNKTLYSVQKLREHKDGTFVNASQYKSRLFKGSIERLAGISSRGNLNRSGTRRILAGIMEWYAPENPMLEGVYSEEIADMLERIAANEKPLEAQELKTTDELFMHE